jgi:hypothetical protein
MSNVFLPRGASFIMFYYNRNIVQDRRRRAALTDRLEWPPPRFILPTPCVCVCFVFALWERDDAENCRATFNRKKKEEVGIRMKKSRFGWLRGAQIASLDILFLYITFLCGAPPFSSRVPVHCGSLLEEQKPLCLIGPPFLFSIFRHSRLPTGDRTRVVEPPSAFSFFSPSSLM